MTGRVKMENAKVVYLGGVRLFTDGVLNQQPTEKDTDLARLWDSLALTGKFIQRG